MSTIARALKSIEEQYKATPQWKAIYEKVSDKAILSPSGDQDDTYATYIHPNWPNVRSLPIGMGGVALAYGAAATASAENARYYSADWTTQHISSRGPLGAFYRVWGDGKQMVKGDTFDYFGLSGYSVPQLRSMGYIVWTPPRPKGEFIGEGDTFTYLNLVDNGLLGYDDATQGGWAGHAVRRATPGDTPQPPSAGPNFTPAAQNALAARLAWSVTPTYAGANHEPHVTLRGSSRISARPGATVRLEAVTSDPDGNAVTVKWWPWKDVDTYPGDVRLSDATSHTVTLQVPTDAVAGQTIQLVVEATDNGRPSLTRYTRVVLTVMQ